jgi:hypothetical protein
MKRTFALSVLILASAAAAFALEAKEGLVKLVVNESNARVSLYRLTDVAKSRYEALIFDQDPRTSYATLSADGKLYKLGDSSELRVNATRTDGGVRIEFRSSSFVVRQDLDFIRSAGSALPDGVRVTFSLENISEREVSLGLRYLIDTWLAEKSGTHFYTDKRPRVNSEATILKSDSDSWIGTPIGPYPQATKSGFMIQISGDGIDRPDKVTLANWKRLSDATWGFEANGQRNFTLAPYSINDSAAALFWEPLTVARGGTRKLSFAMGCLNEKGYPAADGKTSTEQIFAATVLGAPAPDAATSMAADLVAVRDLIGRMDRALAAGGGTLSADELATWKKILDRLEERKKGY